MKQKIKKIGLVIILILLIVLLIFAINVVKKFIIINKITKNMNNIDFTNYYCKEYSESEEASDLWRIHKRYGDTIIDDDAWCMWIITPKDCYSIEKEGGFYTTNDDALKNYYDDRNTNYFYHLNDAKSFKDNLEIVLKSKITEEEFNNVPCYAITSSLEKIDETEQEYTVYVDKDTLLRIGDKTKSNHDGEILNYIQIYETEIGTQNPEDFEIQDLLNGYISYD